eukprot:Opistho-2@64589
MHRLRVPCIRRRNCVRFLLLAIILSVVAFTSVGILEGMKKSASASTSSASDAEDSLIAANRVKRLEAELASVEENVRAVEERLKAAQLNRPPVDGDANDDSTHDDDDMRDAADADAYEMLQMQNNAVDANNAGEGGASESQSEDAVWRARFHETDAAKLREYVEALNGAQTVRNRQRFPSRPPDGPVVVIQVHDRPQYFRLSIESLRNARGVENALIVVSHDYWNADMLEITWSIDFAQSIAIFMPHAMQLHPDSFPGTDPKDCPRDLTRSEARQAQCNNAEYPDMYGHYREAPFAMTKHHWWWKANFVFTALQAINGRDSPVVMMEGDHVVSPDFFEALDKAQALKKAECSDCGVITMGTYDAPVSGVPRSAARMFAWRSSEHNMGMVLDRASWSDIASCADPFCTYDDYNWDWTLQYLGTLCLSRTRLRGFSAIVLSLPRIFHIGSCGMHKKSGTCDPTADMDALRVRFQGSEYRTPITEMRLDRTNDVRMSHVGSPNGGWGDKRDHDLCRRTLVAH